MLAIRGVGWEYLHSSAEKLPPNTIFFIFGVKRCVRRLIFCAYSVSDPGIVIALLRLEYGFLKSNMSKFGSYIYARSRINTKKTSQTFFSFRFLFVNGLPGNMLFWPWRRSKINRGKTKSPWKIGHQIWNQREKYRCREAGLLFKASKESQIFPVLSVAIGL